MTEQDIDFEAEYNNRARVPDHPDAHRRVAPRCCSVPGRPRAANSISHMARANASASISSIPIGDDAPVVLFIHGGYWQALDKSSASHLARGANLGGFAVAVPSYDLAPGSTSRGDRRMHRTGRRFRGRTDTTPPRRGRPFGGRAPGGLSDGAPHRLIRPIRAGMPISGLFDLAPLVSTSVNKALGLTPEEAARLSPLLRTPPPGAAWSLSWEAPRAPNITGRRTSRREHGAEPDGRVEIVPAPTISTSWRGSPIRRTRLVDILVELAADA